MKKNGHRKAETILLTHAGKIGRWRGAARKFSGYALSLLALLTLASCGGSAILAEGGIGGTGIISVGTITALGSIFVNDIEFDTSTASIDLNGASADQSTLKVGMVVSVEGTVNADGTTGVATSVVYDDNLQGPVSAVDPAAGSLIVLDQQIRTDAATVFENAASLAGLGVGDFIEVSGLTNADGSIQASRIIRKAAGQHVEITGQVSNATATTFMINNLTVDFSGGGQGGMPGMTQMNAPQNGETVEVRGNLDNNGVLIASQLQSKGNYSQLNRRMQLTGYIQTSSANSFTVTAPMGALTVVIDAQTVFLSGTAADLQPGALVEVTGSMSQGTLTAREVYIVH